MEKYVLVVLLFLFSVSFFLQAQDVHRRANYYDTFIEINDSIDSLTVIKSTREMFAYRGGKPVKKYMISLGEEPVGKKQFEGDMRTPEGLYFIDQRDKNSSYHSNLGISYPNIVDSAFAASKGQSAGGEIKIHGFPNNHKKNQERDFLNRDWTIGCIAVSDFEVDELHKWVKVHCPILINP
jgi:murein L,D-transpeptidase YafK